MRQKNISMTPRPFYLAAVSEGTAAFLNCKRRSTWEVAAVGVLIELLGWITTILFHEYHHPRHPHLKRMRTGHRPYILHSSERRL